MLHIYQRIWVGKCKREVLGKLVQKGRAGEIVEAKIKNSFINFANEANVGFTDLFPLFASSLIIFGRSRLWQNIFLLLYLSDGPFNKHFSFPSNVSDGLKSENNFVDMRLPRLQRTYFGLMCSEKFLLVRRKMFLSERYLCPLSRAAIASGRQ